MGDIWKVKAIVKLKEGVLDVQGRAIEHAMKQFGYSSVDNLRVGKYVEFETSEKPTKTALNELGENLLANPIIETIDFSIESKGKE